MANVGGLAGRLSFIIKAAAPVRFGNVAAARAYSVYGDIYIRPTYKKADQEALKESGEALTMAHQPVLPARTHETSSEFHDPVVQKFLNMIMRKGKKEVARKELETAFGNIKRIQLKKYHNAKPEERESIILDPIEILHKAIENATPVMQLMNIIRSGTTYQVPVPILEKRQRFLGMTWLVQCAKEKPRPTDFHMSLARELIDSAYNQGRAVRKKVELHKHCEANRAYAHYRWINDKINRK